MIWSWSTPAVSKYATLSVSGQYVGAPGFPCDGHVCTEPPGRSWVAPVVGVTWATGRPAAAGSTVHVPPVLSIVGKPFCVRKPPGSPPGSDVLNRFFTAAL